MPTRLLYDRSGDDVLFYEHNIIGTVPVEAMMRCIDTMRDGRWPLDITRAVIRVGSYDFCFTWSYHSKRFGYVRSGSSNVFVACISTDDASPYDNHEICRHRAAYMSMLRLATGLAVSVS